MIRLIYASSAVQAFNAEQLSALLEHCQRKNRAKEITGILLYCNGTFFQVLEGEAEDVNQIYALIEKDSRHKDCTIIEKIKVTERAFPYWSMGYEKIAANEIQQMDGMNGFSAKDFSPAGFAANTQVITPLLGNVHNKLVNKHQQAETTKVDNRLTRIFNRVCRLFDR
jgi:hypothetical protein